MTCRRYSDRFVFDYLNGKLDDAEAAEFAAHMDACAACQTTAKELEALSSRIKAFASTTRVEPTPAMKSELMEQARKLLPQQEKPPAGRPRITPIFRSALRYAAVAAVILGLGWLIDAMRGSAPTPNVVASSISDVVGPLKIERASQNKGVESNYLCVGDIIVSGSEPAAFTYNNSCRIRLEPNSTLTVASDQGQKVNALSLQRGEMRANACNCDRELRISTCCGTIRCTGAEFSLKADSAGNMHLTIHKGSACVECPCGGSVSRLLHAGEEMSLAKPSSGHGSGGKTNDRRCRCSR
ncbi:MAG: hypothetical protein GXP25_13610 [Planctomycetes bacterium]|nr:hypothetical protein [Planctomycetota bacterium]